MIDHVKRPTLFCFFFRQVAGSLFTGLGVKLGPGVVAIRKMWQ